MAADKITILSWLADLSAAIVTDVDDAADIANRLNSARLLGAADFAREALDLVRIVAESSDASEDFDRLVIPSTLIGGDTLDALSVMLAVALAIAGCRVDWPSRPLARKARSRIGSAGDVALEVASSMGGDGADLYGWLSSVFDAACRVISDLAANAIPIVKVQSGISLPSTVLAYRLYGDANRSDGLVDIAGAGTPLVMPTIFDALAS